MTVSRTPVALQHDPEPRPTREAEGDSGTSPSEARALLSTLAAPHEPGPPVVTIWPGGDIKHTSGGELLRNPSWERLVMVCNGHGLRIMPKLESPLFAFSRHVGGKRKAAEGIGSDFGALAFDVDVEPHPERARDLLRAIGLAYFAMHSPSHLVVCEDNPLGLPRERLVLPLATPFDEWGEDLKRAHDLVRLVLSEAAGITISPSPRVAWLIGTRPSSDAMPRTATWSPGRALDGWKALHVLKARYAAKPEPVAAPTTPTTEGIEPGNMAPSRARAWATAAMVKARNAIESAAPGHRTPMLYKHVAAMGQIEAVGLLSADAIRHMGIEASRLNGAAQQHGEAKVRRDIESALKAGRKQPRKVVPTDSALITFTSNGLVMGGVPYPPARAIAYLRQLVVTDPDTGEVRRLTLSELAVAEAIAERQNFDSGMAVVTRRAIAQRAHMRVAAVTRITDRLVRMGVLWKRLTRRPSTRRVGSTDNAPNRYKIRERITTSQ